MEKIRIWGICAGNGVCLYPFKDDRFDIEYNIEPRAVFYDKLNHQWSLNFPNIPQIRTLKEHHKLLPSSFKSPHLIIGHPDCGHASILRLSRAKKNISAKDNQSMILFIDSIICFRPEIFLMENLPGLLKTYSKEGFEAIFDKYNLKFHISSVSAYGNSQVSRERLVIVGIRKDLGTKGFFKLPNLEHLIQTSEKFEHGPEENPKHGHVREPKAKECNLYYNGQRKITYALAQSIWNTTYKGKSRWGVGGKMKNQPGVSRNLDKKYPFTVRKQNRQFGTDGMVLSPREMANIQGLPKSFRMDFPEGNKIYWLNKWRTTVTKSMPIQIAAWFAEKAYKTLKQAQNLKNK